MFSATRPGLGAFLALTFAASPAAATVARLAYVIGSNDASVTRVDLSTGIGAPVASVGAVANRITVSPDLSFAAVVCSGSDDVRVLDLLSEAVSSTIPLPPGTNPWDAEIAGGRLYVTSLLDDRVLVVDLASSSVVDSIPVGRAPEGMCVAAGKLFVTNTGFDFSSFTWEPGSVSVIDLLSSTVISTVPVGLNPQECLVGPDHRVHVVCTGDFGATQGSVDVLDPALAARVGTLPVTGYPGGAAAAGSAVWMQVTTTSFSSAVLGYDAASLAWVRDASDPLLPSLDFYGNVRATMAGQLVLADFSADLLLVEDPASPGLPGAFLVGDGPIDTGIVEREGTVSLALSGLSAIDVDGGVRLTWHSTPEAGVAGFDVERSLPGGGSARVATGLPPARQAEWIDRDVPEDVPATWTVRALDTRGRPLGAISATWVRRNPTAGRLAIRRIAPNPSRESASIEWFAPRGGIARLEILDVLGRRVAAHDLGSLPAGSGSWHWDGRCGRGEQLAPGVFFVRLVVDGDAVVERGLRLR